MAGVVYKVLPKPDTMLYGVTDAEEVQGIIPILQGLVTWSSKLPRDLSRPLNSDVAK
jgi:hypothetical protein